MDQKYLEHVGILGMKWGSKKSTASGSKPKTQSRNAFVKDAWKSVLSKKIKDFTPEDRAKGKKLVGMTLATVGILSVSKFLSTTQGQSMLRKAFVYKG